MIYQRFRGLRPSELQVNGNVSIVDVTVRAEFGPVYFRISDLDQTYHFVVTAFVLPVKMAGVTGYVPVVEGQFFGLPGKFGVPTPYVARVIPTVEVSYVTAGIFVTDVAGGIDCILDEKVLTTFGFILRRCLQVATVTGLGRNVRI